MTRLSRITALGVAVTSLLVPALASAQTAPPSGVPAVGAPAPPPPPAVAGAATAISGAAPVYVDKANFKPDSRPEGWGSHENLGMTVAFANNSNVVGQADGSSFSFGMKGDAGLDYNHQKHEWRNTLGLVAAITRTPLLSEFVKTSDNLNFDSIYLYHALPWFGPFVLASLNTSMFRGSDVEPTPVKYVLTKSDGTPGPVIYDDHLSLSDPFRPLTFKQSAGLFAQAYQSVPVTTEIRLGAGAQEVIADNQIAVTGSEPLMAPVQATVNGVQTTVANEVDLQQLANANQLGPELAASIWGTFIEKSITYKVNLDVMTPGGPHRAARQRHPRPPRPDQRPGRRQGLLPLRLLGLARLPAPRHPPAADRRRLPGAEHAAPHLRPLLRRQAPAAAALRAVHGRPASARRPAAYARRSPAAAAARRDALITMVGAQGPTLDGGGKAPPTPDHRHLSGGPPTPASGSTAASPPR